MLLVPNHHVVVPDTEDLYFTMPNIITSNLALRQANEHTVSVINQTEISVPFQLRSIYTTEVYLNDLRVLNQQYPVTRTLGIPHETYNITSNTVVFSTPVSGTVTIIEDTISQPITEMVTQANIAGFRINFNNFEAYDIYEQRFTPARWASGRVPSTGPYGVINTQIRHRIAPSLYTVPIVIKRPHNGYIRPTGDRKDLIYVPNRNYKGYDCFRYTLLTQHGQMGPVKTCWIRVHSVPKLLQTHEVTANVASVIEGGFAKFILTTNNVPAGEQVLFKITGNAVYGVGTPNNYSWIESTVNGSMYNNKTDDFGVFIVGDDGRSEAVMQTYFDFKWRPTIHWVNIELICDTMSNANVAIIGATARIVPNVNAFFLGNCVRFDCYINTPIKYGINLDFEVYRTSYNIYSKKQYGDLKFVKNGVFELKNNYANNVVCTTFVCPDYHDLSVDRIQWPNTDFLKNLDDWEVYTRAATIPFHPNVSKLVPSFTVPAGTTFPKKQGLYTIVGTNIDPPNPVGGLPMPDPAIWSGTLNPGYEPWINPILKKTPGANSGLTNGTYSCRVLTVLDKSSKSGKSLFMEHYYVLNRDDGSAAVGPVVMTKRSLKIRRPTKISFNIRFQYFPLGTANYFNDLYFIPYLVDVNTGTIQVLEQDCARAPDGTPTPIQLEYVIDGGIGGKTPKAPDKDPYKEMYVYSYEKVLTSGNWKLAYFMSSSTPIEIVGGAIPTDEILWSSNVIVYNFEIAYLDDQGEKDPLPPEATDFNHTQGSECDPISDALLCRLKDDHEVMGISSIISLDHLILTQTANLIPEGNSTRITLSYTNKCAPFLPNNTRYPYQARATLGTVDGSDFEGKPVGVFNPTGNFIIGQSRPSSSIFYFPREDYRREGIEEFEVSVLTEYGCDRKVLTKIIEECPVISDMTVSTGQDTEIEFRIDVTELELAEMPDRTLYWRIIGVPLNIISDPPPAPPPSPPPLFSGEITKNGYYVFPVRPDPNRCNDPKRAYSSQSEWRVYFVAWTNPQTKRACFSRMLPLRNECYKPIRPTPPPPPPPAACSIDSVLSVDKYTIRAPNPCAQDNEILLVTIVFSVPVVNMSLVTTSARTAGSCIAGRPPLRFNASTGGGIGLSTLAGGLMTWGPVWLNNRTLQYTAAAPSTMAGRTISLYMRTGGRAYLPGNCWSMRSFGESNRVEINITS